MSAYLVTLTVWQAGLKVAHHCVVEAESPVQAEVRAKAYCQRDGFNVIHVSRAEPMPADWDRPEDLLNIDYPWSRMIALVGERTLEGLFLWLTNRWLVVCPHVEKGCAVDMLALVRVDQRAEAVVFAPPEAVNGMVLLCPACGGRMEEVTGRRLADCGFARKYRPAEVLRILAVHRGEIE